MIKRIVIFILAALVMAGGWLFPGMFIQWQKEALLEEEVGFYQFSETEKKAAVQLDAEKMKQVLSFLDNHQWRLSEPDEDQLTIEAAIDCVQKGLQTLFGDYFSDEFNFSLCAITAVMQMPEAQEKEEITSEMGIWTVVFSGEKYTIVAQLNALGGQISMIELDFDESGDLFSMTKEKGEIILQRYLDYLRDNEINLEDGPYSLSEWQDSYLFEAENGLSVLCQYSYEDDFITGIYLELSAAKYIVINEVFEIDYKEAQ